MCQCFYGNVDIRKPWSVCLSVRLYCTVLSVSLSVRPSICTVLCLSVRPPTHLPAYINSCVLSTNKLLVAKLALNSRSKVFGQFPCFHRDITHLMKTPREM